ncbi:transcriptional regulator [Maritimibacter sp. 55A14]|uniref:ArsR/SmtB family transcription factor n=1 Tax=Maritimibacter sp. 55A14 TaxID=2174844 RepID=UPI000D61B056|nr:metalloregulator ArsR/SmtB family transcription factor [Maritimibacter sp. 55A14]PWE31998.1 transcriptional regulator [Maritimibacter sp. 55A14]
MPFDREDDFAAEMKAGAAEAAALMKTLSNPSRLMIICLLVEGEKSVAELARALGDKQPSVSQHLARLRAEGLVVPRRAGRMIFYALNDNRVRPILEALHAAYCPR